MVFTGYYAYICCRQIDMTELVPCSLLEWEWEDACTSFKLTEFITGVLSTGRTGKTLLKLYWLCFYPTLFASSATLFSSYSLFSPPL